MLEWTDADFLNVCTCQARPLEICMHHTPCRTRCEHDLSGWCDTCLHDLCRDLADNDVSVDPRFVGESLAILAAAIEAELCPSCRRIARVELAELRTVPDRYALGTDGTYRRVPADIVGSN